MLWLVTRVAPDAMASLVAYDFPGNVRELENLLERAFALGANDTITIADLPSLKSHAGGAAPNHNPSNRSLEDFERDLIASALQTHGNDKARAAEALGLSERTLYRRLKKLGLN
jgi:DNA-binding NtrC family response regulator